MQYENTCEPMNLNTRSVTTALFPALLFLSSLVPAAELVVVEDFAALGKLAENRKLVVLVSVTQEYCPYCHKIKEEILQPMLLNRDYDDKVLIRELSIDPGVSVTDFRGRQRMAGSMADDYKVWVTLTLLFLGPDGTELTPRMLGVQTVEMYGYYVDESIDQALRRLRDPQAPDYRPTSRDIGEHPSTWDDLSI
jgi:thioredoxin-related protein